MTIPAPTVAELYPIRNVRFVGGRTHHHTKRPEDERWWDLLEAACGKTGSLARGYLGGVVRECGGCARVMEANI